MKHIVSLSGGIGSYITLKRVISKNDKEDVEAENDELAIQRKIGQPFTHLKRKGKPYSLRQLRMDKEAQLTIFDFEECNDFGACTCFSEMEEEN